MCKMIAAVVMGATMQCTQSTSLPSSTESEIKLQKQETCLAVSLYTEYNYSPQNMYAVHILHSINHKNFHSY